MRGRERKKYRRGRARATPSINSVDKRRKREKRATTRYVTLAGRGACDVVVARRSLARPTFSDKLRASFLLVLLLHRRCDAMRCDATRSIPGSTCLCMIRAFVCHRCRELSCHSSTERRCETRRESPGNGRLALGEKVIKQSNVIRYYRPIIVVPFLFKS